MSEIKKSYYAIIPATVRYDPELTPNAKLLYGEITALCNEKGYCWAGDKYFSELYGVNRTTIQRWIKQLEDKGYIERTVKYKEGTRNIETRYMHLCDKGTRNIETPPTRKNETDNITSSNTTLNNIVGQPDNIPYKAIVDYLNKAIGTNYRHTTKKTRSLIKARFNEGFTEQDFYTVIDKKAEHWLGTESEVYLRPETLFGNKFEGYLNQKIVKQKKQEAPGNDFNPYEGLQEY